MRNLVTNNKFTVQGMLKRIRNTAYGCPIAISPCNRTMKFGQPFMLSLLFLPTIQEVTLKDNELATLRKQIEREFLEKIKVEDNIMEKMRSQLTLDKAAQYTKKVTDKLRRRATELV